MDRQRIVRTMFRPNSPMLESAQLEHQEDGTRNAHGVFLPAAPTITKISVVTAPISGEEREILPVGLRSEELRTFWVKGTVQGVDDLHDADVIAYRGGRFRAERIEAWGDGFSEVLGVRIET